MLDWLLVTLEQRVSAFTVHMLNKRTLITPSQSVDLRQKLQESSSLRTSGAQRAGANRCHTMAAQMDYFNIQSQIKHSNH